MTWDNCSDVSKLESYFQPANGSRTFGYSAEDYFFKLQDEKDYLNAYNLCAPLKAIVGKRAKAFNSGEIVLLNASTRNEAIGSEAKDILKALKKPNIIQNTLQFMAQQSIYVDIFGYCPVLVDRPVGMPGEITGLWNVPPWLFDISYTREWLLSSKIENVYKEYFIYWGGKKTPLDFDSLKFVFDDGIGTESDANLTIPDSRLLSLEYPVSNIVASYKSRNTLITKRGAIGILSNAGADSAGIVPIQKSEKEELQKDFKKYGIVGQPYQIIVTDAALQWQQIGFPTKDLMLFEEIEDSVNRICDSYDYPAELISRSKSATLFSGESKKEVRKALYTDSIIPESKSRMAQLSEAILGKDSLFEIVRDYSELPILQEDKESAAKARAALNAALKVEYDNGLITKNDWLEELGKDRKADTSFNEYVNEQTENRPAKIKE